MTQVYDVPIVGGILGNAHACLLARSGMRIAVFERESRASGASVRNFGMTPPAGAGSPRWTAAAQGNR